MAVGFELETFLQHIHLEQVKEFNSDSQLKVENTGVMSAPAGLHHSQPSFLARWMQSTSRAGVILNPDLTESLRNSSTWRSQDVDDSFASQFAPLPVSTSSSCHSVDAILQAGCGKVACKLASRPEQTAWPDKQLSCLHPSRLNSLGDMDSMEESPDLPLMLKLEQLRQWQQQMQEQLKAHQLEELLHLQEEQQRLLAMVNVSQEGADTSNLSKADWGENTLVFKQGSPTSQGHPASHSSSLEPVSTQMWRQEEPSRSWGQEEEEEEEEDEAMETTQVSKAWSCKEHSQEQSVDGDLSKEHDAMLGPPAGGLMNGDLCEGDEMETHLEDRPIKPGVGGQKLTFEELLEEQLRLEEQRLKSTQLQQSRELAGGASGPPRRTFLKRGEGLARFSSGRKAPVGSRAVKQDTKAQEPLVKVNARWTSESKTVLNVQPTGSKRPPVQRKTAVLNKENRPKDQGSPQHQDGRAEVKLPQPSTVRPKVPGGHQKINLLPTQPVQMYPEVRQTGLLKDLSSGNEGNSAQQPSRSVSWDGPPQALIKRVSVVDRGNALRKKGNGSPSREDFVEGKPESEAVPEYSFEVSFQEKLKYWDHEKQAETAELGEFELLEQAADELSFSSNSSFVMKVLQMDQHYRRLQSSGGDQPRRLSSTPIKSPRPSPPKTAQSEGGKMSRNSSTESESVPLKSKRKASHGEDGSDYDDENNHKAPDISFHSELEFDDQDVIAGPMLPPTFSTNNCFSASNLPYDKRSYQDQDQDQDGGHGSGQAEQQNGVNGDTSDTASDITSPDESTLMEDKEGRPDGVVFDDEDPWNDPQEADGLSNDSRRVSPAPMATASKVIPPERSLTRKVAAAKGVERQRDEAISPANNEPDPPPTSQLMARLFPSLKPKSHSPPSAAPEARKTDETAGQQVQSRQLRERLVELELEIERFRTENAALGKLRQENERNQENLRKERAEFEQSRAEELARFEEYKKEETKKLQRERKVFEKHASAARAIPDKKERDEIQALKQQLTSMQEELKRRESRWSTTHVRLRQQIDTLSSDNIALKSEVNTLEKLRLAAWKKSQADAEREKENARERREKEREWPRMLESTSAPVTKGVTFASPPIRDVPLQSSTASTRLSPRDHSPAATVLTKSSLRRKSAPSPAFSVFPAPDRSPEEKAVSVASIHNTAPVNQDCSNNPSSMADGPQTKTVLCKVQESNDDVITYPDGKVESVLPCGGRLIVFPNGTRKEVSADGGTAKVTFFNGDIKQVLADKRVIYYYADARTTHTTYPDGIEILQFPNNQTEKHFPDGRKEITFPDQTVKNLFPDGREESVLMDGTIIQVNKDGSKEIQFNTGQKEIHTADYKKREYPDGTVKTVYTDGRQETRYPNGRIRVKDKDGNVVMDNRP